MVIEIVQGGLATSVQDLGRPGYFNVGIPPSGSLDQRSALIANLLVGNSDEEAVLEAPFLGPELTFHTNTVVAVTGGDTVVTLNDAAVLQWAPIPVSAGDTMKFGPVTRGARIYVAVAGGIDVPKVLGSRSTYALGAFGGHEGRVLQAGDRLDVGEPAGEPSAQEIRDAWKPVINADTEIRVVLGLYDYRLTETGRQTLMESDWKLTPVADRIGFRYQGPALEWVEREQPFGAGSDLSNVTDSGYSIGSIQVPGGLEPIMLHRDAVSAGGYATIGTLINADFDRVAQCTPGTTTKFVPVSVDEAVEAWKEYHEVNDEIRRSFR